MRSKYKSVKLSSGLRFVVVPMSGVESVTLLAMVGVGSRYEPASKAGVAHFLEHMVFKGTENYPTAMDISSTIDGVGGQFNAFTGKDYTGYYVKLASSHLELGLDVISDMLLTPKLREEDLEREKGVIVEEINMYEDDPRRKIGDIYDTVVYGKSPLGREIIGSKKTVRGLNRNDFSMFLDRWYDLSNVVVVLAGDSSKLRVSGNKIQKLIEKYFSKGKKRQGGGKREHRLSEQKRKRLRLVYKETEQAHFYLGVNGLKRGHKDRYALSVLATVLGGNSSARLFSEIREKRGLAYYAYASAVSYKDAGSIYAFEGVDPKRVDEAITLTLGQFTSMGQKGSIGLTDKEVRRGKEFILGKLVLDLEDSHSVAMVYARKLLLEGKIITPDEMIGKVKKVTVEQVRGLALRLFKEKKLDLALIGPYKDEKRFSKLLAF